MKNTAQNKLQFKGFVSPRYTQVPDELFDDLMSHLSGAELKVLLYVIRRTFGFKKDTDNISLSQICNGITTRGGEVLDKGTGLSKQAVITALKGLIDKNTIVSTANSSKEKGHEATTYSLNLLPLSNNLTRGGLKNGQALVQKLDTQETVLQKTDLQYRNSNIKIDSNNSNGNKRDRGTQSLGDILQIKTKPKAYTLKEVPLSLKVTVQEISDEFGDRRNARSNLTHVMRLVQESGKNIENFYSYLHEARSITKQQGNVKRKMPYFFEVLNDVIGLKTKSPLTFTRSR